MRHVVEGRLIVQRQRDTVARLAAAGRPTSDAEALLNVFLGNLAIFEEHERWLRDNSEEI